MSAMAAGGMNAIQYHNDGRLADRPRRRGRERAFGWAGGINDEFRTSGARAFPVPEPSGPSIARAGDTGAAAHQVLQASSELSRQSETMRGQVEAFLSNIKAA
jgi:hypothetical protein